MLLLKNRFNHRTMKYLSELKKVFEIDFVPKYDKDIVSDSYYATGKNGEWLFTIDFGREVIYVCEEIAVQSAVLKKIENAGWRL